MTRTTARLLALALSAPLLLGACAAGPGSEDDQALPDVNTSQDTGADDLASKPNVVGLMVSTTEEAVTIKMPDGTNRVFKVRPEDAPSLGLGHLASHAGLTDIGFKVFYETEGDVDYVVGAFETAPPQ